MRLCTAGAIAGSPPVGASVHIRIRKRLSAEPPPEAPEIYDFFMPFVPFSFALTQ